MGGALGVPEEGSAIGWRRRDKPQPPNVKFTIPAVDAPERDGGDATSGFPVNRRATAQPDLGRVPGQVEGAGVAGALRVRSRSGEIFGNVSSIDRGADERASCRT